MPTVHAPTHAPTCAPAAAAASSPPAPDDGPEAVRLPPLREDLHLLPAPPAADGASAWTLHDPVRNRYFRIGEAAFEALARWHLAVPRDIAAAVAEETVLEPTAGDVLDLYRFLAVNNLVQTADTALLERQDAARRVSWFWWLIHNYLYVRIPLVRPDRFLARTQPLVAPFYSPAWIRVLGLAGLLGGTLALRQWDSFVHTFLHFASPEGLALYGLTLAGTKILHELGHACTARRYGCRVPTMGIAFLVLWPVLYTDTTDAWRLVSRRRRLAIAAAGIVVELALAVVATLAWSFLPDGPPRSAAFLVATVTWVSTLAVNLSPFMRFDGYYLLADALDVPNLQDRAFALARWRLREALFGLGEEPPERFPARLRRVLLLYAYVTWIYRLVLFLGIALLVYHTFTKVLGILLFAVEIGWFVLRPLAQEARAWWRRRDRFRPNRRTLATLTAAAGIVWAVAMPVTGTVTVPAVWRASDVATIYAPFPARLDEVLARPGRRVAAGDVLFRLAAPDLDSKLRLVELRIVLLQDQVARLTSSGDHLDRARVLNEDLAAALAERQGLTDSRARLEVVAPLAGVVTDTEDALRSGRWIGPGLPLALVVAPTAGELVGYIGEADLERVQPGAAARFHPDDPLRPRLAARVRSVDRLAAAVLDVPALASVHGGPVAVEAPAAGGSAPLVPVEAVYRVTLEPLDAAAPDHVTRGVVRVDAAPRSLASRLWQTAVAVLIRETGF